MRSTCRVTAEGDLVVGIDLDPTTAQIGDNKITIEVRDETGHSVQGIAVDAYAQMAAMGAMAAMRAPAGLKEVAPGRHEGTVKPPYAWRVATDGGDKGPARAATSVCSLILQPIGKGSRSPLAQH